MTKDWPVNKHPGPRAGWRAGRRADGRSRPAVAGPPPAAQRAGRRAAPLRLLAPLRQPGGRWPSAVLIGPAAPRPVAQPCGGPAPPRRHCHARRLAHVGIGPANSRGEAEEPSTSFAAAPPHRAAPPRGWTLSVRGRVAAARRGAGVSDSPRHNHRTAAGRETGYMRPFLRHLA
jgi:hypothetical protein